MLKEYLKTCEGVLCNPPNKCFREVLSVGWLNEEQTITCLEMYYQREGIKIPRLKRRTLRE